MLNHLTKLTLPKLFANRLGTLFVPNGIRQKMLNFPEFSRISLKKAFGIPNRLVGEDEVDMLGSDDTLPFNPSCVDTLAAGLGLPLSCMPPGS